MRIVFMGTPEFSVPTLEALIAAGHEIVCVYSQPPRPAGRGKKDRLSPVHHCADGFGLTVKTPRSLKTDEAQSEFAALQADVGIVVAYGLLLPQAILDAPMRGCLNIHASLLPRWRGAAPIHRAIMAGDDKSGVCIMQMEAGLDTGPVLLRSETRIAPDETTQSLHDRLSQQGAELIVDALSRLEALAPVVQSQEGVTYAAKIDKSEARIDWNRPAIEVDRLVRGLSPFPGAWALDGDTRIKFLATRVTEGTGEPGTILHDPLRVVCGTGAVELIRLQRAGKAAQDAGEFLRGWPMAAGTQL